ncbi:MAG: DUF3828 domain-containing protein [Rhizomicrobium sp.]
MRSILFAILSLSFALALSPTQAATQIDDPVKFVTQVYATAVGRKPEPDDIYSDRLKALWDLDNKEAHGEVGRVDFDFWMNGQDGTVSGVKISKIDVDNAPNRLIVVSKFKNEKTPNEIHFYFEKTAKGWKLDDVRSLLGDPWVLSIQLKYGWDGKQ